MDIAKKIVEELKPILDLKRSDELTIEDVVRHEIQKVLQARYDERAVIFNDESYKPALKDYAWDDMQRTCQIALSMNINIKLRETSWNAK